MKHSISLANTTFKDKLPSSAEMADYDRKTISSGMPSYELMERAGNAIFNEIMQGDFATKFSPITILCGPGNNGGDGLVVGRLLLSKGEKVNLVVAGAKRYSEDHLRMAKEFKKSGGSISVLDLDASADYPSELSSKSVKEADVKSFFTESGLIIDSLLGTGQKKAPASNIAKLLFLLNENKNKSFILAVDTPSGLDPDSGYVFEPHCRADLTICLELIKRGLLQSPARELCGEIKAISIGIDCSADACEFSLVLPEKLKGKLKRPEFSHKGDYGHVFIIGGSRNMPGAPVLSANAAQASGAGLVTLLRSDEANGPKAWPEIMYETLTCPDGFFSLSNLKEIKEKIDKVSVVVLGPGISRNAGTEDLVVKLIEYLIKARKLTVLDADGLNILASHFSSFKDADFSNFVMTPHPAEMGRLLGFSTSEVQADRYTMARDFSKKTGAAIILKGASSLIYFGCKGYVNRSGNPYMATAGSGDVLSGLVAALLAQKMSLFEAAVSAVYCHGVAGDLAYEKIKAPFIAEDIITNLPFSLRLLHDA